ncbi:MAG TPA: 50S ribosomal protein L7/L12 [Spirochaetota bacterium]|nr:50S ribosomal protein L7/L12 [Spirochaetota bacterium]
MAKLTSEEILDAIAGMTVLELNELRKAFEEKFDVTAASAAPVAVMAGPAAGGAPAAEEQTEFSVFLKEVSNKINVIKVVREITGLGLKEAKDLVEDNSKPIKESIAKAEAEAMKKQLEEAGSVVVLK